jgi:hypothetical protein
MQRPAWIVGDVPTEASDEQTATPDDRGSYGDLMDEIDRLLDRSVEQPDAFASAD